MTLLQTVHNLPRNEKLALMEYIWNDLNGDDEILSPSWHEEELKKTEERLKQGKETLIDWAEAKKLLRSDKYEH